MGRLFGLGWDWRKRAGWWWARARWEVLCCHVGLAVGEGGHWMS